ncbi:MAG: hypothetical protein LW808_002115 [Verrucomicrobiota bacterium]|nr:MAG: hypothetical protein LW808_002115 [Verrucomicrobiota bacterium]
MSGNLLCASADSSCSEEEAYYEYYSDQDEHNAERGEKVTVEEPFGKVTYIRQKDGTIEAPAEVYDYVTSKGHAQGHWRKLSWYGRNATFNDLSEEGQQKVAKRKARELSETGDIKILWDFPVSGVEMICPILTQDQLSSIFDKIMQEFRSCGYGKFYEREKSGALHLNDIKPFWVAFDDDRKGQHYRSLTPAHKLVFWPDMTSDWQGKNFPYYPHNDLVDYDSDKKEMIIRDEVWHGIPDEYKTEENLKLTPTVFQERVRAEKDIH